VVAGCRPYLLAIAQRELDPDLQARGGASDLVQETLLKACQHFDQFRGSTPGELRAWLREILLHCLADFIRHHRHTAKRGGAAEVRLDGRSSSADAGIVLSAETPTPSKELIAGETADSVRRALDRLPPDYRQVILLRYQDELSFIEIGRRMDRSQNAAQKLFTKAILRMREELKEPP
jgi:RNA polymerase sigma-70 factor (ECF subfamily)